MASAIQAVVFDIDGTAIPSARDAVASPVIIDALLTAKSHVRLCAATGRSWDLCKDVIGALGLTDPCIISGGAQIIDPASQHLLWQAVINPASAAAVVEVMARHAYRISYVRGLQTITQLENFSPHDMNAMYILDVPNAELELVMSELAHIPSITVSKALSWSGHAMTDLHITSHIATKEHAVHELSRLINVPTSHMAGVGDGHNDIHLFNAVGHKVAMANAIPELKNAADEIISSVDEDGLAAYILSLV